MDIELFFNKDNILLAEDIENPYQLYDVLKLSEVIVKGAEPTLLTVKRWYTLLEEDIIVLSVPHLTCSLRKHKPEPVEEEVIYPA